MTRFVVRLALIFAGLAANFSRQAFPRTNISPAQSFTHRVRNFSWDQHTKHSTNEIKSQSIAQEQDMQLCPQHPLLPRVVGACVMLTALVGFCRQSAADFFQFGTTVNIGAVAPAPIGIVGNGTPNVTLTTAGNTPIQFTGLQSTGPENLVAIDGGTDIVFGLVDTLVVNATTLQNLTIPFAFDLTITDYLTDIVGVPTGSAVFQVTGTMSGTIGAGRKVNLNNIVVNPVANQFIGGKEYSVVFNTIVPPGPFFPGAIGAHVEIVPEPATWAMLGMGALAIGYAFRRRRRNA